MKRECAIFAGGKPVSKDCVSNTVFDGNVFVIAADKGYELAESLGIRPDIIIGDFDSAESVPNGGNVKVFPSEKDDTDLMLAIKEGLANSCELFSIYGATGGRLDHMIGNIQCLMFLLENGARGEIVSDDEIITLFSAGRYQIPYKKDFSLSLTAYSEKVEGLTVIGTKYTVEDFTLTNAFPIGISNQIAINSCADIEFKKGILLVIQSYLFTDF